jgi:SpoVK/Ycf46/Vps4 family AAA+-type ATPase
MTEGYTSGDISYVVKESARNSFEESIKNRNRGIVKISQTMIEEVIRETKPSVSADEVRRYEKMRDEYVIKGGKEKRRIGFIQ